MKKVEVVAEIGINHNGDLGTAKKLIDVAYSAGCDYVKFQKRNIDLVYSEEELSKPRDSQWGTTTRDQKKGLEFGAPEYLVIDEYCQGKIKWFASPWDIVSFHFLEQFNLPFVKIASAKMVNEGLIAAKTKSKFILSTGGCTFDEIDKAVDIIGASNIYCILHCTMTYPTKPDEININAIHALKARYPWCKVGFSNHYPGIQAMNLAVAHGAEMLEFHLTLDRASVGSDHAASIEPQGLFDLMSKIKLTKQMMGSGKKIVYESELPVMRKLR